VSNQSIHPSIHHQKKKKAGRFVLLNAIEQKTTNKIYYTKSEKS